MPVCSACRQPLNEGAKFCNGCGGVMTAVAAAPAPAQSSSVEAKRGRILALKGFAVSVCAGVGAAAASRGNSTADSICVAIALAIGAGYIIRNLRRWKRNNDVVKDSEIAWTVAVLLLLIGAAVLIDLAIGHH